MKPKIKVVCGIIFNSNEEILITQRSHGQYSGYWEFPGGKLENFESERQCLHRELDEELSIKVDINSFFLETYFEYPEFLANLIFYTCTNKSAKIKLSVHEKFEWVSIKRMREFKFLEADNEVVNKIQKDEGMIKNFKKT